MKPEDTIEDRPEAAEGGAEAEAEESLPVQEDAGSEAVAAPGEVGEEAPLAEVDDRARRLEDELGALNDRYLRLAAEFDNYRKRMVRERSETQRRAQADLLRSLLDAIDDLGRVAHLDLTAATVDDVATGVLMVERKLLDQLQALGLQRIEGSGEAFDPHLHEAVGSLPAESDEHSGSVAQVMQVGYRLGEVLLRPARVLVFMAHEGAEE